MSMIQAVDLVVTVAVVVAAISILGAVLSDAYIHGIIGRRRTRL